MQPLWGTKKFSKKNKNNIMGRAWASWYSNWNCKKRKYTHSANEPLHTHTQTYSHPSNSMTHLMTLAIQSKAQFNHQKARQANKKDQHSTPSINYYKKGNEGTLLIISWAA